MSDQELKDLWENLLALAEPLLPAGTVETWLKSCVPLSYVDDTLTVDAANVFIENTIRNRYLKTLEELMSRAGLGQSICLTVPQEKDSSSGKPEQPQRVAEPKNPSPTGLNPNYKFSSFVVGRSNRLAHAASLAVADNPGSAYSPLFIWGGVGLGKTHLMHAIGRHALAQNPRLRVTYVSSEKFTNELITAIKNNKTAEFRSKYRHMDLLLIDDIQFIAGKESTQEEFFHTFNTLHDNKKQIVLSSDRPPKEISDIEERLVSRFEWGLVTDIQQPDYETRIAILKKKAESRNYPLPDEVAAYLAQNIPSNIRELEGSLNRVIACAELSSEQITVERAVEWLKDMIGSRRRGVITIETIQQIVAEECGFTVEDLVSRKRTNDIALSRQIAMFLCRTHTECSLQQISTAFRKKDHTTVLHAHRKISSLLMENLRVKALVENIEKKL